MNHWFVIGTYLKIILSIHKMELCLSIFQILRHNLSMVFDSGANLEKTEPCKTVRLKSGPVLNISQSGIFFFQFLTLQYFFKCSTRIFGSWYSARATVEFGFVEFADVSSEKIIKIPKVNSLILKWKYFLAIESVKNKPCRFSIAFLLHLKYWST